MSLKWLPRDVHLKSDAFAMMDGLRFLNFSISQFINHSSKVDNMHLLPTGLEYLPNKLRYLKWYEFPLKSLPPSFRAERLVELHLCKSKLVKLCKTSQKTCYKSVPRCDQVSNDFTKYGMVTVGGNFNQRSSTISY